jgi:hypothetical protein
VDAGWLGRRAAVTSSPLEIAQTSSALPHPFRTSRLQTTESQDLKRETNKQIKLFDDK